jgi:hypothetical protein
VGDADGLNEGGRLRWVKVVVIIWRKCFKPWDQR